MTSFPSRFLSRGRVAASLCLPSLALGALLVTGEAAGCGGSAAPATSQDAGKDATVEASGDVNFVVSFGDAADVAADVAPIFSAPDGGDSGTCVVLTCPGQCVNGRCLVTLASSGAYGLDVDGVDAYWSNQGAGVPGAGTINRTAESPIGSRGNTVVAAGQSSPGAVAVDGHNVYWVNDTNAGALVKAPKTGDGGGPVTLASGQDLPSALAIDGVNVYWTTVASGTSGTVMMVPIGGGAPVTLASGQAAPSGIAVDGSNVYWLTSPPHAAVTFNDAGMPILDAGAATGAILAVPKAGGTITTLVTGQHGASALLVDSTSLYWSQPGTTANGGAILRMPKAGGTVATLASGQGVVTGMTLATTQIYWLTIGSPTVVDAGSIGLTDAGAVFGDAGNVVSGGAVVRAELDGSGLVTLIANQSSPSAIAVDPTRVFWTDSISGLVQELFPR